MVLSFQIRSEDIEPRQDFLGSFDRETCARSLESVSLGKAGTTNLQPGG
jgi:hypothetical protein